MRKVKTPYFKIINFAQLFFFNWANIQVATIIYSMICIIINDIQINDIQYLHSAVIENFITKLAFLWSENAILF